jgi:N-ethylmaleimide reductase
MTASPPNPPSLFTSHRLGDLTLPNRVVMAPMARVRAAAEGLATILGSNS